MQGESLPSVIASLPCFNGPVNLEHVHQSEHKITWVVKAGENRFRVVWTDDLSHTEFRTVSHLNLCGVDYIRLIWHFPEQGCSVYNWVEGQPLFRFNDVCQRQALTTKRIANLAKRIVELHCSISDYFSPTTDEPSYNPDMSRRHTKAPASAYRSHVVSAFNDTWKFHLARCQKRQLHSAKVVDNLKSLYDRASQWIDRHQSVLETVSTFSLLHGDLHPENIICDVDQVGLIDFECSHYGDRSIDLAFMFEQLQQSDAFDDQIKTEFLRHYWQGLEQTGVTDINFGERLAFFQSYVLWKFLILVADGLTTVGKTEVNKSLFEHLLERSQRIGV